MPSHLRMRWPELDRSVRIELMQQSNPSLTDAVLNSLPLVSIQSHAVVAGEQMYFPTRIIARNSETALTESMDQQPIGRVNFEPFFQYLSLNYGAISEAVPAWPIAQVREEDLPALPEIGRQVLDNLLYSNDFLHVILEDPDGEAASIPSSSRARAGELESGSNISWQELLTHLEEQTAEIWLTEPNDVRALRLGISSSDAGVGGQYFSPWVMVAGLVRSLAINDLAAMVRLCQEETFELAHLKRIFHEALKLPVEVIGYFGLPILGRSLGAAYTAVQEINHRDDYCRFLGALLTYVNRYNLWLHQTFPWRLGQHYPKFDPDQVRAALDLATEPTFISEPSEAVDRGREEAHKQTP